LNQEIQKLLQTNEQLNNQIRILKIQADMTRGKPDPNVWALNNQLNDLKTQLQESQFTHKNIMMDY
jgi:hypothetical protein